MPRSATGSRAGNGLAHRRYARALAHIAPTWPHPRHVGRAPVLPPVSSARPDAARVWRPPRAELEEPAQRVRHAFGIPTGPYTNTARPLDRTASSSSGCRWTPPTSMPSPCLSTTGPSSFLPPTRTTVQIPLRRRPRTRPSRHHGEHVFGLKQVESQAHAFAGAFLMPDRRHPSRAAQLRRLADPVRPQAPVAGLARRAPPASEEPRA